MYVMLKAKAQSKSLVKSASILRVEARDTVCSALAVMLSRWTCICQYGITRNRGSSVNIVIMLRAGWPGFYSRQWHVFFSSPPCQDLLWGPFSLLSIGYRRLYPWG